MKLSLKASRILEALKDFLSVNLGLAIYSLGWAAFLLPYHITTGGMTGLFAILYYLMEHPGWVVDRDTLLRKVWGEDYFGVDRVVDNHVKRLRKALGSAGDQIHTVFGRGYKISEK